MLLSGTISIREFFAKSIMKTDINHIIASVLAGQATESERKVLNNWLRDPENFDDFMQIKKIWETKYANPKSVNYQEKRDQLWREIQLSRKGGFGWNYFLKIAAVMVIAVAVSFFIIQTISMESSGNKVSARSFIEKVTPAGIKSTFNLPDGSKVTLNAGSKLTFPASFDDTVRFMELTGEAFFQVVHDSLHPFVVKSGHTLTTALGTSFNISAYPGEATIDIALSTGKVKVDLLKDNDEAILLEQGEYISLEGDQILKREVFDNDTAIGWKDGLLVFNQSDFKTIIRKLERWYGVTFVYESVPTWVFDGKFKNENLENILKVLSHSEKFSYSINNDKTINLTFYETP